LGNDCGLEATWHAWWSGLSACGTAERRERHATGVVGGGVFSREEAGEWGTDMWASPGRVRRCAGHAWRSWAGLGRKETGRAQETIVLFIYSKKFKRLELI
jgi:hypothetical protein